MPPIINVWTIYGFNIRSLPLSSFIAQSTLLFVADLHPALSLLAQGSTTTKSSNTATTPQSILRNCQQFIVDNYLLFALTTAVVAGLSNSAPGKAAGGLQYGGFKVVEFARNVLVFLISGLTLRVEDLRSIWHQKVSLYGIVMINFITTLIAFATRLIPFNTAEFAVGLTIFVTVPTTLGNP